MLSKYIAIYKKKQMHSIFAVILNFHELLHDFISSNIIILFDLLTSEWLMMLSFHSRALLHFMHLIKYKTIIHVQFPYNVLCDGRST